MQHTVPSAYRMNEILTMLIQQCTQKLARAGRGCEARYQCTIVEKASHRPPWVLEEVLRAGHLYGMEAVLDHSDGRRLQLAQHVLLRAIRLDEGGQGVEGYVPLAVLESGDRLLHTHRSPDVTSLQQHGGPVHHEGTQGLPGPSHGGKLHVCAKLGGGGARYLGTSDWHRGSEKLELWVCTIFGGPVHKAR